MLVAVELHLIPVGRRHEFARIGRPQASALHPGQRRHALTRHQRGQQGLLLGLVGQFQQRRSSQHRAGEERRAGQRATQLLLRDAQFFQTKALTAKAFWHVHAGEAKLLGEAAPQRRIVTTLARHLRAHRRHRRTFAQKARHDVAKLFLFPGVAEMHRRSSSVRS